jgi:hypothetical protein
VILLKIPGYLKMKKQCVIEWLYLVEKNLKRVRRGLKKFEEV